MTRASLRVRYLVWKAHTAHKLYNIVILLLHHR